MLTIEDRPQSVGRFIGPVVYRVETCEIAAQRAVFGLHAQYGRGDFREILQVVGRVRAGCTSLGQLQLLHHCKVRELESRNRIRADEGILQGFEQSNKRGKRLEGPGRDVERLIGIARRRADAQEAAQQIAVLDFLVKSSLQIVHAPRIAIGRIRVGSRSTRAGQLRTLNHRSDQAIVVEGGRKVLRNQRGGEDLRGTVRRQRARSACPWRVRGQAFRAKQCRGGRAQTDEVRSFQKCPAGKFRNLEVVTYIHK